MINLQKSDLLPKQQTIFLGVDLNTCTMQVHLHLLFCSSSVVLPLPKSLHGGAKYPCEPVSQASGSHGRSLNGRCTGLAPHEAISVVGQQPQCAHPYYTIRVTQPQFLTQSVPLGKICYLKTITTEASVTGWGTVYEGFPVCGVWGNAHFTWHKNCLEMFVVFLALDHFLPDLQGCHVVIRTNLEGVPIVSATDAVYHSLFKAPWLCM